MTIQKEHKQALHIENSKLFSRAEANENERRWGNDKIDRFNRYRESLIRKKTVNN